MLIVNWYKGRNHNRSYLLIGVALIAIYTSHTATRSSKGTVFPVEKEAPPLPSSAAPSFSVPQRPDAEPPRGTVESRLPANTTAQPVAVNKDSTPTPRLFEILDKDARVRDSPAPPTFSVPIQSPSDYFTVGSTKAEVLAIQGEPDSFTAGTLEYGSSRVYFQSDRVTSWRNNYPRLKAALVPAARSNSSSFTVGSTKDEVLGVQGTPDSFTAGTFEYGSSRVYFQNDRVTSWRNNYPRLKGVLTPTTTTSSSFFTVGSTRDEVLSIQGTPDSFTENVFEYGSSRVYFQNNRVTGWRNNYPRLKAVMLSAVRTNSSFFTVGSNKDEVLAIQGTPDSFTENVFEYGSSRVYFQSDRVTSWRNNYPRLKALLSPTTPTTNNLFTVGSTRDEVLAIQGTPDSFSDNVFEYGSSRVYFQNGRVTRWQSNSPTLKARIP